MWGQLLVRSGELGCRWSHVCCKTCVVWWETKPQTNRMARAQMSRESKRERESEETWLHTPPPRCSQSAIPGRRSLPAIRRPGNVKQVTTMADQNRKPQEVGKKKASELMQAEWPKWSDFCQFVFCLFNGCLIHWSHCLPCVAPVDSKHGYHRLQ